jgi:hypothetical protein
LALLDAQSHQPARESFHFPVKLLPGKPLAGMSHHKGKTVGKAFGVAIEHLADTEVQQLGTIRTFGIAEGRFVKGVQGKNPLFGKKK